MQVQEIQRTIPVRNIVQGRNPREYFAPAEMAELVASVKVQGVIQPIRVRPVADQFDKFEIVAGERRWRAAKEAHGEDFEILAVVRDMTDAEVDDMALIENIQRSSMSVAEEAKAAARILGSCEGDRDEAARRLGWPRETLDSRLALMNCSDTVLKAVAERQIKVGHAELLAAVTKDKQDAVLARMRSQPVLPTVADLKAMLSQIARQLDVAIFDKEGCTACQYNSAQQRAMFQEALAESCCTRQECYDEKTEAALTAKAEALKEDYPTIRIVRSGENFTLLQLRADGSTGVGAEQAQACRACQKFGAAVSAVPGKVGSVFRDLCFDPACNAKLVAARIKAEKNTGEAKPADAKKPGGAAKSDTKAGAASSKAAATKDKPKVTVQEGPKLKEYRVTVWRKALNKALMLNPAKNLVVLIALSAAGKARHIDDGKIVSALDMLTKGQSPGRMAKASAYADAIETAGEQVITVLHQGLAASAAGNIEEDALVDILKWLDVDLAATWKLNADYLALLTKSEIDVVAAEIGLKAAAGDKFSKMVAGKKDEAIKALLAVEGFAYEGQVPKHMRWA